MKNQISVSVFHYSDYRRFLKDAFALKGDSKKPFSYRAICGKTGIKSSGHLTLVLQGKANISIRLTLKFARFCKLNKRETEYFQYLVLFNQAKSHHDKLDYFRRMISFKESLVHVVDANQYEYYNKWYHSAIRALLEIIPVNDNFEELANAVQPRISVDEAQKSLALLERLGLAGKDEKGFYRPTDRMIDSGPTVGTLALTNYALNQLDLGKEAFDRFPVDERIFSWVTLGISERGYARVVEELRAFRQKMYEIAKEDTSERVYQINIQAFPVSDRREAL
jgi:uncharacterized protein (TIGR02147 family)